jgi:hypothetical protein
MAMANDVDVTSRSAEQLLALVNQVLENRAGALLHRASGKTWLRRMDWVPPAEPPDDDDDRA